MGDSLQGAHGEPNISLRKCGSIENNPNDTKVGVGNMDNCLFLVLLELNM